MSSILSVQNLSKSYTSGSKNLKVLDDSSFELEEGKYLAPQLLHPDKIKFGFPYQNFGLRFEYWYKFMPKGIISRFIVEDNTNNKVEYNLSTPINYLIFKSILNNIFGHYTLIP